ncbi:MAG: serpin family protein, partial [Clostridiales bacterium]|nr:serpin family protein [Clostridiales bacterium]
TDVFDFTISDFSPMTTDIDEVYVEKAEHAARVAVDEDGCIATAYTVMSADGGGMPPADEVDFVLDRPFMFVITGVDGLPLFAGVVNHP